MKTRKARFSDSEWSALEKISGALIGVDLVALIQLIGLPSLNARLTYAVAGFAISLPGLTFVIASRLLRLRLPEGVLGFILGFAAMFALLGVAMLILHLSVMIGGIFLVLFIAGMVVIMLLPWFAD
jgi:hypothetical protein